MDTYLRKDYLPDMNSSEAGVYIALKMLYDKNKILTKKVKMVELNFTLEQLFWELSGSFKPNRYDKDKLKQGLQSLEEYEIVKVIDTDGKNYVVDATKLYLRSIKNGDECDDLYVMATREEIRTIFNLNKGRNYGLLRFAMLLFGTLNNSEDKDCYKCGFMAVRTAVETFNLSGNQIYDDYFKTLEENEIICVHRSETTKIQEDGSVKTLSNIYGRLKDKEYVDKYAKAQQEKEAHDFRGLPNRDKVTKKLNKFLKDPDSFSESDIVELYEVCSKYNDMKLQREGYIEKYDLSVFNGYSIFAVNNHKLFGTEHLKQKQKAVEAKPVDTTSCSHNDWLDW